MPAFKITCRHDDGTISDYVTSMAKDVSFQDAKDYFLGKRFEVTETTFKTVINVEEINTCQHCGETKPLHKVKCEDDNGIGSMNVCNECDNL